MVVDEVGVVIRLGEVRAHLGRGLALEYLKSMERMGDRH
jgi:hypothetical protein